jgi:hypothetical protein
MPLSGIARRLLGRRASLLMGLWLGAGFVVWNVVFDRMVVWASRDYVSRQQQHLWNQGPAVTIDEVMIPARIAARQAATYTGAGVTVLGLAATAFVNARRKSRPPAGHRPSGAPPGPAGAQ